MRKTLLVCFTAVLFVASVALVPSFASAQEISISPSSLSFGQVTVNTKSAELTVQVHNGNKHPVTILHIYKNFPEFTVISPSLPLEIASDETASFKVEFAPLAVNTLNGDIILNLEGRDGSTYNISIPVSGSGKAGTSTPPATQPQISVTPASVSFSNVSVGTSDTQAVTVKNTGTANLTISSATVAGSSFSVSGMSTPMSIAPGASSTVTVGFTPTTASSFYANLSLINNSPTSPVVVSLSGTSVAPVLTLSASPTSINFGSLTTGTNSTQTVTLTNKGNASVSVSSISVSGTGFSHTSISLPVTLAAGQATSFGIEFSPASAGSLTGTATVSSTASNSPVTIALAGTGAAASTYSVALNWAAGTSTATGFNIYRGTTSGGPYSKLNSSTLTTTSYTDSSVTVGKTYYYVATEQNSEGQESSYSNQVTLSIP
jgi:hypothetical protein